MQIIEARPAIDLTRHHFVKEYGDLRLYGTWLYREEDDDDEPALVLVPANRREGFEPFVVPLSSAYLYTYPRRTAVACLEAAKGLGMDGIQAASKIANIVHDHLQDLIEIPENPTETVVGAYGQINDGHRVKTVEILDHVPVRQI